eukprot:1739516-Rhodomonas_salina.1
MSAEGVVDQGGGLLGKSHFCDAVRSLLVHLDELPTLGVDSAEEVVALSEDLVARGSVEVAQ